MPRLRAARPGRRRAAAAGRDRRHARAAAVRGPLHPRTLEALAEVEREGGKAIVLINRRGWSTHLACRSCGRAWQCPDCDVSLVLHRSGGAQLPPLRPRRAGARSPAPTARSVTIARVGAGTQRIETELAALLEPLPVFRSTPTATAGAEGHGEPAAPLRRGRLRASWSAPRWSPRATTSPRSPSGSCSTPTARLRLPDFRAEERTFALITQLAGRSGRGGGGGQGAGAGARDRRAEHPARRRATTPPGSSPRSSTAARSSATRPSRT